MLAVAPTVFANEIFAMKGGTAINLVVRDMPRLSVDIDVVYTPWQVPREEALQAINSELAAIAGRVDALGLTSCLIKSQELGETKMVVEMTERSRSRSMSCSVALCSRLSGCR
ncbi:nucleotidyl transferase AbiEii/AbiGii toxin family protein [Phyllobacterium chamaecytisi]|uniref:nucleotidyl transferase AbiEii/AbiGii toxin family protein n=1 Tax=Phyllobacterium chamaecytisi TaxID=2876082 RepID=UPI004025C235